MPQIHASPAPPSRPPVAGAAASGPQSALPDGFEALLAGLMGLAIPPVVPLEPARPITLDPADTARPNAGGPAAEGDAPAETAPAGDGGRRPAGEIVPALGRAELPPAPSPGAVPLAVASGEAAADPAPASTRPPTRQPIPPPPGAPLMADEAGVEAAPEPRPLGLGASPEATRAEPPRPPVALAHRPEEPAALRPAGERPAGERPAGERPVGERPAALIEAMQQAKAQPDMAAAGRALPVAIQARPGPVDRQPVSGPLVSGPLLVGGRPAFAPMALLADWGALADVPGSSGLAAAGSLTVAGERAALASAEALAAGSQPAVRQLAAAIDRAVGGELRHLTIQLSPKALGTIEIALEFDADRRLAVAIFAERPETLELLRGEARELQRLLAQHGIDLTDAGLELGLMGGERRFGQPSDSEPEPSANGDAARGGDDTASGPEPPRLDLVGAPGRLNLSI